MVKYLYTILFVLFIAAIFYGCGDSNNPADIQHQGSNSAGNQGGLTNSSSPNNPSQTQSTSLGVFSITYLGRTVDSLNNKTTFTYFASGNEDDLTFILETPPCSTEPLLCYTPTSGVSQNVDGTISPSIQWSIGSEESESEDGPICGTFTYTIGGIVREGTVQVGVAYDEESYYGTITGPSKYFDISGSVFTDANQNGLFDGGETGIANATLTLLNDSNIPVGTTTSNASGNYLFQNILCGNYTVKLDTNSLTSQTQSSYLSATTPTQRAVSIGPDSPGNNFGFTPKTQKLIADIGRTLPTNGFEVKEWKKQFIFAINNGNGSPFISRSTLLTYLSQINNLLLPSPFQFTLNDAGLQKAYDILKNPAKSDLDKLLQQLLTTELNYQHNRGLADQTLQLIVIGWAESVAASVPGAGSSIQGSLVPRTLAGTSPALKDVTIVLSEINSGGGGGLN